MKYNNFVCQRFLNMKFDINIYCNKDAEAKSKLLGVYCLVFILFSIFIVKIYTLSSFIKFNDLNVLGAQLYSCLKSLLK